MAHSEALLDWAFSRVPGLSQTRGTLPDMPLTIYRRHSSDCSHKSKGRRWHRCDCAIWVQGSLGGEYVRESLNLTVWGAAQERVRGWEASGHRKTLRAVGQGPTGTSRAIDTAFLGRPAGGRRRGGRGLGT